MRTLALALSLALGLFCCATNLNARIFTLTKGATKTNDALTIGTNEMFSILSSYGSGGIDLVKDGMTFNLGTTDSFNSINSLRVVPRVVIAGPATLSLFRNGPGDDGIGLLTIEIQPDLFPPDKTLVVPQGDGANILLESSTNLVNWYSAPPGAYTNKTSNLFFRLRAERLP